MAKNFLTPIDLNKNELLNAVVHNNPTPPATPVAGQLYFDTTGGDQTLYWYDGAAWVAAKGGAGTTLASSVTTQAIGDAPVVGISTDAARADHKHGLPAFAAATATTTFGLSKVDGSAVTLARSDHTHGTPTHDAAAHSAIPISALSAPSADVAWGGFKITNLGVPTAASDASTKDYVDNAVAGLSWKDAVRAASTANITRSGLAAIDGVTPVANDRILLKNQTAPAENGVYLAQSGAWTRALDVNAAGEVDGMAVFVLEGTTLADTAWVCTTNPPITLDTTGLAFVQFAGTGGAVPPSRNVNTTAPLAGGGPLSGDLTLTVAAATEAAVGVVELASIAEATAQSDTARAVTPAGLADRVKTSLTLTGTNPIAIDAAHTAMALSANRTLSIINNGITNTHLATMAANTVKMNNTGGTAAPTDVTVANLKTAIGGVPSALPVPVTDGGTGRNTSTTAYGLLAAGTTATGIQQTVTPAASGFLKTTNASALPAWTAITTADVTNLDTALAARTQKFTQATVGGATSQVITHNLNTQACVVNVYRTLTPWDTVECDIERTTVNTVTLRFSVAPGVNEYSVVVIG